MPSTLFPISCRPLFAALALAACAGLLFGLIAVATLNGQLLRNTSPQRDVQFPAPRRLSIENAYGQLPLSFEANRGQVDSQVKFLSRGKAYTLFLTQTEAVLAMRKGKGEQAALRMKLMGANRRARVAGLQQLPGKVNYFSGAESAHWRTSIPTYQEVSYQGLYPGSDSPIMATSRKLEYDFVVATRLEGRRFHSKI